MVECQLPKLKVAGSIPVTRSRLLDLTLNLARWSEVADRRIFYTFV
jgi:hypothetical protein